MPSWLLGMGRGSCKEGRTKEALAPPYRVLTLEAVVCPTLLGQLSGLGVGKTEPAGGGQLGEAGQTPGLADLGAKCREKEGLSTIRGIHNLNMDELRWIQHAYRKC